MLAVAKICAVLLSLFAVCAGLPRGGIHFPETYRNMATPYLHKKCSLLDLQTSLLQWQRWRSVVHSLVPCFAVEELCLVGQCVSRCPVKNAAHEVHAGGLLVGGSFVVTPCGRLAVDVLWYRIGQGYGVLFLLAKQSSPEPSPDETPRPARCPSDMRRWSLERRAICGRQSFCANTSSRPKPMTDDGDGAGDRV